MAGAPGSKWSAVARHLYSSSDMNVSDQSEDRLYAHSAWGPPILAHTGSYFDPGMEFGDFFEDLSLYTKDEIEAEFNRAFSFDVPNAPKLIKSHVFSYQVKYLIEEWPEVPIIMVLRSNDACLGNWVNCGAFDIKYPNYRYYKDLKNMNRHIKKQNGAMRRFIAENRCYKMSTNWETSELLGLRKPSTYQNYNTDDIEVYVYWKKYEQTF